MSQLLCQPDILSWLWKVGSVIHLGHKGDQCPQAVKKFDADLDIDKEEWFDWEDIPSNLADPKPPDLVYNGGWVMTIVHTSGVHYLPDVFCGCSQAAAQDIQLLRVGLYPSTYKSCKTVFTLQLLDDYLLENLECKTSATHYYSKLRRITNFAFPNSIPNRYHELIRVGRQYCNLTELATSGFGHTGTAPKPGEMVFFCPTCPQPGVNLPDDWNENPDQSDNWKCTRGFVADGNFTAAHQKQARPEDDVWLKDGDSFMTRRGPYLSHLWDAIEVNDIFKREKGYGPNVGPNEVSVTNGIHWAQLLKE
ncbi:hypothetical protein K443DRAFT_126450 [Laccaria amethystina LaAM-08-1]|uniref:Unplaced genomic scaffold K443scaffold_601, whole genome shotgun sequence n=1 Tax=Laccaria amethystina LaAM-08-1 TaxID=1095629 RepID=A0A0C9X285_9AGAR|nr:hypothetical protein K443DRAFT_126450 [Laccaria amethystina LaAM-08-1]